MIKKIENRNLKVQQGGLEDCIRVYVNIYGIHLHEKYLKYQDAYVSF